MQALSGSDGQLWNAAGGGDRDAFAEIYRRHADRVFTHCVRRCGSDQDAADLTGQVFAETWARRSAIHLDEFGLLPWLLGTANNLLKGHYRAAARRRLTAATLSADVVAVDPTAEVIDRVAADQLMGQIRSAIGTLTPADQDIVWLCAVEGLSPTAVATQLGVPAGTVRSRLSRALKQLRSALQPVPAAVMTTESEA